jgi:chromosome partitioning protein
MHKQARLISVVHPKGGVGKTTVTMVLAGELANRGYRVLVADCDA